MSRKNRKKILFVIWGMGSGGAERVLLNILKFLDHGKFESVLILFEKGGKYFEYLPPGLRLYILNKKNKLDTLRLVFKTAGIVGKEKPDIVLSFGYYANTIVGLSRIFSPSRFSGTRLCLTEHTYTESFIDNLRFAAVRKWMVSLLYRRADLIIAVSDGVKKNLVESFSIPENKIRICNNPVDLSSILRLSREPVKHKWFDGSHLVVIAVGNLTAAKGYPYLLEAFSRLRKKFAAKLAILGGGEKKHLEKLAEKLGIEKDVAFLGFRDNPFKYMAKSSVFVLPSLWEGFGNVIVEAMACGVPVVATISGSGPKEIISDWENGFLVPAGDVNQMAEAIGRLLSDKNLRGKVALAGRQRAEDFRAEKKVAEYEKIFEGLLEFEQGY